MTARRARESNVVERWRAAPARRSARRARLRERWPTRAPGVGDERDAAEHRDEDTASDREVVAPPHGNLRTRTSRTSASSATSTTPGTSRNGKRSSIVRRLRLEPGLLEVVEDRVHALLEARLVGRDEGLAAGVVRHRLEQVRVHREVPRAVDGLAEEVRRPSARRRRRRCRSAPCRRARPPSWRGAPSTRAR